MKQNLLFWFGGCYCCWVFFLLLVLLQHFILTRKTYFFWIVFQSTQFTADSSLPKLLLDFCSLLVGWDLVTVPYLKQGSWEEKTEKLGWIISQEGTLDRKDILESSVVIYKNKSQWQQVSTFLHLSDAHVSLWEICLFSWWKSKRVPVIAFSVYSK